MTKFIVFAQPEKIGSSDYVDCVGTGSIIRPDQRYSINNIISLVLSYKYPIPTNAVAFYIASGNRISKLHRETKYFKL